MKKHYLLRAFVHGDAVEIAEFTNREDAYKAWDYLIQTRGDKMGFAVEDIRVFESFEEFLKEWERREKMSKSHRRKRR